MRGLFKIAFLGALLSTLFAVGWHVSGRDVTTFRDGLSQRFRDRGAVAFGVIKKISEDSGDDDLTRESIVQDARRALEEAKGAILTDEDSKVSAILYSYFTYLERAHQMERGADQYNKNSEKQIDLIKELATVDKKAALVKLAEMSRHREQQRPTFERVVRLISQAKVDSKNCDEAASKYFESSPSPSEGLNKLCQIASPDSPLPSAK